MSGGAISVRGGATAEEVAAVLALLTRSEPAPPPDPYRRWRQTRLAALRAEVRRG
jgi:hypothetical protein